LNKKFSHFARTQLQWREERRQGALSHNDISPSFDVFASAVEKHYFPMIKHFSVEKQYLPMIKHFAVEKHYVPMIKHFEEIRVNL
jgi:hypothetical protein